MKRPQLKLGQFSEPNQLLNTLLTNKSRSTGQFKGSKSMNKTAATSIVTSSLSRLDLSPDTSKVSIHFTKSPQLKFFPQEDGQSEINQIKSSLQQVGQQMNKAHKSQINSLVLMQWQQILMEKCERLIKVTEIQPQQPAKSSRVEELQKQLQEEKRNRLTVEEQTNQMITVQEVEIKRLINRVRSLEQQLLEYK